MLMHSSTGACEIRCGCGCAGVGVGLTYPRIPALRESVRILNMGNPILRYIEYSIVYAHAGAYLYGIGGGPEAVPAAIFCSRYLGTLRYVSQYEPIQ